MVFSIIKTISCIGFFLMLWAVVPFRKYCLARADSLESRLASRSKFVLAITFFIYLLITAFLFFYHEPFHDEAQAWLIARDTTSLSHLFSMMGYEGSPGLWHLILYPFAQSGGSYQVIFILNFLFAAGSIFIWLYYSPFPLFIRVLLPFTYIFIWEYPIIARSYALSCLLLFAALAVYIHNRQKWFCWCLLFALFANTNIHSAFLCCGFIFYLLLEFFHDWNKQLIVPISFLAMGILLVILQVLPPEDLASGLKAFKNSGSIYYVSSSLVTVLYYWSPLVYSLLLLQVFIGLRNRSLFFMLLSVQAVLILFFLFKYPGGARHHFFLFLSILTALWIGSKQAHVAKLTNLFLAFVLIMLVTSSAPITYQEYKYSFSNGYQAAAYLKNSAKLNDKTFVASYRDDNGSTLLPYLPSLKLFYPQSSDTGTYVIWSKRRETNRFIPTFTQHIAQIPLQHPTYERYIYITTYPIPVDSTKFYNIVLDTAFTERYHDVFSSRAKEKYYLYTLPKVERIE